ncbi:MULTISPECIES: ATP-dependent DNA helicase DinG [Neobacillus]|uniref:3'-5' exonuclease DinG n=1 Tax=Neobacillus rhizophilus TaxID=2833579 RepID=A0A942U997_9BACI|nr:MULTISPECIES: ATP-dependent DNA helicase DinG [Neobacillus]MBS4215885.1 ATP-dependent DNA helicase DinG [Neobacillus rhizophilus]
MSNKFVVIDLETTGNLPKKGDKIIQFAAVVIEDGQITEKFSSLINPQKSIPIFIEELTGINDEMVKNAPVFSEIAAKVFSLLDGAYFVAHNVLFDLSFLQEELIHAGFEGFYGSVLDTVEMSRILYPTADGYKLTDLAEMLNLKHDRPHQADSDAEVTAEIFLLLVQRLQQLPFITLKRLLPLSGGLKSDLEQLLEEMIDSMAEKSAHNEDFEVFRDLAIKKVLPQPGTSLEFQAYHYPQAEEEKLRLMKSGLKSFENRTGQFKMMDVVYKAFVSERHTLIEAGTGVGKSLGYLLPAVFFAKQRNRPIIVSTHTTQLQEQILRKEMPLLEKMIPFPVKAVLLKGRSHYICLEKFHQSLLDENDNYDTTLTKMQILVWLTETETGDKDELNLSSGGFLFWNKIKNEQTAFSKHPDWQERDFYLRAKKEAKVSDIVITNHSLLLSDIKGNGAVLPEYDFAVIDEGHHLEKAAVQFFGTSLDYLSARMLAGQFGLYEQEQLFYELEKILAIYPFTKEPLIHTFELNQMMIDFSYEMDEFFKLIALFAKKRINNKNGYYRTKIHFSKADSSKERMALVHSAERLSFLIKDLHTAISKRVEWIIAQKDGLTRKQEGKIEEVHVFLMELEELRGRVINSFLRDTNDVKWIEIDVRAPQNITTFIAQPASVAAALEKYFFAKKKAAVITSATLTVNNTFDYYLKEIGLDSSNPEKVIIPSPFNYKEQVQLIIPDDLPEINSVSLDEFVIAITEHIITIAEATKGRMLLLFTAYDMLKKTYELIKESGFLDDYVLIAQGITSGSRTRLTRNFQRYEKAILLGTSSFWEGVDIPGEDLSCLCLVRLPFNSPDEPLTMAKCQIIEESGGNAFFEYSLPEAVLRFKQGFGRLIRTETDRGIVIVFDKRIITTKYGKAFLNSIPPVTIKKESAKEIVKIIQSWL